jgi:outer membrane lipoprotein carrier protein
MIDIIGILTRAWLGTHAPLATPPGTLAANGSGSAATPTQTAPAKTAPTPTQVLDGIQDFYKHIDQVTAKFKQTVHNATFGKDATSEGQVMLKKPGKMRWDYLELKKGAKTATRTKSFLSNGSTLWVIENANKQVIQKDIKSDLMPVAVSFLYGKGNLKTEFNAEFDSAAGYGDKGDLVLKLTPKQPSAQYKNLYLVVNPKDFHVRESVIIDSSNNKNQFEFFEPNFDKQIADSLFEFDKSSVPNFRIINADKQQGSGAAIPGPTPPEAAAGSAAPAPAPAPAPAKK